MDDCQFESREAGWWMAVLLKRTILLSNSLPTVLDHWADKCLWFWFRSKNQVHCFLRQLWGHQKGQDLFNLPNWLVTDGWVLQNIEISLRTRHGNREMSELLNNLLQVAEILWVNDLLKEISAVRTFEFEQSLRGSEASHLSRSRRDV